MVHFQVLDEIGVDIASQVGFFEFYNAMEIPTLYVGTYIILTLS